MGKYVMVVHTSAADGRDDEFNRWYDDIHLPDLMKVPGIKSAERLIVRPEVFGGGEHKYLALYNIEIDDPKTLRDELTRRGKAGEMQMSDSMGGMSVMVYEVTKSLP